MHTLDELSNLGLLLLKLEDEASLFEDTLKAKKENIRVLKEETIPLAMQEAGVESFTLNNGYKLSVKQEVYSHINKDNFPIAVKWLEENGFSGIVKSEISVAAEKGNLDKVRQVEATLKVCGFSPVVKEVVHPMTLKSFVKEQLENGYNIPFDLFGIRQTWTTKVKK